MNVQKVTLWVGLTVAIIGGFVEIPYTTLILLIGGLIYGLWISGDTQVRAIVSSLALAAFASYFGVVPAIGDYLTHIVGNLGTLTAGAAVMIVLRNITARAMP